MHNRSELLLPNLKVHLFLQKKILAKALFVWIEKSSG